MVKSFPDVFNVQFTSHMESDLDKGYEPAQVEPRWARFWEEEGLFGGLAFTDAPSAVVCSISGTTTGTLPFGLRPGRPLGLGAPAGSEPDTPATAPPMTVSSI